MLNRATVMGHVGKDPDVRATQAGNKVATFSVATSERWTDKNTGEQKEHTEWHRIVVWGDAVVDKLIAPNVKKGSKIYIEGQMKTREYEKDGVKKYVTEIVVQGSGSVIRLLDPSERKGPPPVEAPPTGRPANGDVNGYHAPLTGGPPEPPMSAYENEIPF